LRSISFKTTVADTLGGTDTVAVVGSYNYKAGLSKADILSYNMAITGEYDKAGVPPPVGMQALLAGSIESAPNNSHAYGSLTAL
jgi:hypothetical protein